MSDCVARCRKGEPVPHVRSWAAQVRESCIEIEDFRTLGIDQVIETDLCIIGSGPAGLTIAGEFAGTGVRTLILESGGLREADATDKIGAIESIGEARIMTPRLFRNRVFGGTSHSWSGRCAPFDEIDFAARPWVPFSGWPMERDELDPYLHRACPYLGLAPVAYDDQMAVPPALRSGPVRGDPALRHCVWQFSKDAAQPVDYMRFGPAFARREAPNVRVLLNATVCHVTTNETGSRLIGLEIRTPDGKRAIVRPRAAVLCAGGLENARILLYSNRILAAGVGNQNGIVGRFLMDHPRCMLAEFDLQQAKRLQEQYGLFRLGRPGKRHSFVRGISLSETVQRTDQLLNCAAWLTEDRSPDDPWDAARRLLSGDRAQAARDAWRVLSQPATMASGVTRRLLQGRNLPHKLRRLVLDCIVEQRPDPESRLTLGEGRDPLGLPVSRLDWRISDQEKATVAALGTLIRRDFADRGLPRPDLAGWVEAGDHAAARFIDVCHPTGTTRMSHHPREGVVDADCRIHGLDALFIAGSSVFPTSGHANPTLMIVAFAIRLADRLKATLLASCAAQSPRPQTQG